MNSADVALPHGYTLADLHRLARMSAAANRTMAADHRDLLDTAWSAIAEAIYAAETWPSEHDLLRIGKGAIWATTKDHRTTYGFRDREWDAGLGSAPRFAAYWLGATVTPGPEDRVVERYALPPILAALGEPYRDAITALAAHDGDRDRAAAALGINLKAFNFRIRTARAHCLRLWLQGETPVRTLRRPDRRRHRGEVAPCGTVAAALRHRDRRERLDEACAAAEREYDRQRKARRAA
jgi:hypothetical protein